MNILKNKRSIITAFVMLLFAFASVKGQTVNSPSALTGSTDSLTLKNIIERVVTSHPTVKDAEEAINNANARIGLAKTGYYPNVDLEASYANIGPVVKLSIPDLGTFQLYPVNNYSAAVNFQQVVYDFGRTRQNVELENESKLIGEQALEQVKQKMSMLAVNNYYTLVYLQAAILIKNEEIATLNEHLQHVEKMLETGSATEYQLLSTRVKISAVESQRVDLLAALKAQQAFLNSMIGNDDNALPAVKNDMSVELPQIESDSLLSYAYQNRNEVLINEKKEALAELRYGMIKLQNKPMLSIQASAGAKNGYIPNLEKIRPNYVVGLGFRVPIFDGNRTKYNLAQAQSSLASLAYESDFTRRTVSNELLQAEAYMSAAKEKIGQFELQLKQARRAYSLAETSFSSGVITNLDLLDANTSVSESELMLLKARIDYAASVYTLKAALGERIY
jgi:outer membrane protein